MGSKRDLQALRKRRMRAAGLFEKGFSQAEVARRCGVTRQTAMVWYRKWQEEGKEGLEPSMGGRPTKLTASQIEAFEKALLAGPQAHGWSTDLWTLERASALIERLFGVHYHPGHVWRVLRAMGWSLQRPTTRARERDEEAILRWKKRTWPRLKKTTGRAGPSSS
jgi:transposase